MKRNLIAAAMAAAFFAAPVWAQPSAYEQHHGRGAQMNLAQRDAGTSGNSRSTAAASSDRP